MIIGVIGAVVLRAIMILIGAWLIAQFHWILYVFGAFLLTGIRDDLGRSRAGPDLKNPVLKWMRGHLKITKEFVGEKLTLTQDGTRWFTPLFVVVVLIGITDVIFAVTPSPRSSPSPPTFIVMTSNVSSPSSASGALYFLLADLASRFHLLKITAWHWCSFSSARRC